MKVRRNTPRLPQEVLTQLIEPRSKGEAPDLEEFRQSVSNLAARDNHKAYQVVNMLATGTGSIRNRP